MPNQPSGSNEPPVSMLYDLHERPPLGESTVYAVQWLTFTLANSAVVPLVIGTALGLDQAGIASLAQRTLLLVALASLLQVWWGHRLPIMEGPAGMWLGIFISLAALAPGLGKPLEVLRTDLQAGLLVAGVILLLVGSSRLISSALRFFTPAVTGTVLVMLGLQLSGTFVSGMLGVGLEGPGISLKAAVVSVLVVTVVIWITLKASGFMRSIAVLIGLVFGWLIAMLAGLGAGAPWVGQELVVLPRLFAWGTPTLDPGIILTCVLVALLALSNLVASIMAMEKAIGRKLSRKTYDRGVTINGVADLMAGAGSTVGFVPYSAGAALVGMTRVASRLPFILFALALMVLALLPVVGAFLASIPAPVGYSVLMVSFCQMFGFGLRDYLRLRLDARDYFVVGLAVLFGTGIMFLPPVAFEGIPILLRYVLGNGFIAGMLLCMLLEHVFLPAGKFAGLKDEQIILSKHKGE